MQFSKRENILVVLVIIAVLAGGIVFVLHEKQSLVAKSSDKTAVVAGIESSDLQVATILPTPTPIPPPQKLSNPPTIIRSIYVTGNSAGSKSYLNYLTSLFKNTDINAVVVDVKGSNGYVTYASGAPDVKKYNLDSDVIPNIDDLVRFFHSQNIYVIGRVAVFEDPMFAKARPDLAIYNEKKTTDRSKPVLWQNSGGLNWMDPASKEVWGYDVSLAQDAFANGFDEVNFDYVRFPTDGQENNMGFPVWDEKVSMADTINSFFHYVRSNLPNEKISADLFGLTTVNDDDMGIGQLIQNAFQSFDYVAPMVYPSHYANGFIGFANPAEHPYDVIKYSMDHAMTKKNDFIKSEQLAIEKNSESTNSPASVSQIFIPTPTLIPLAKYRPWLQDFNMKADYTADMVDQEIKATKDSLGSDYAGFMLWNAGNVYTEGAVLK